MSGDKAGALADYAKARALDSTIPAVSPNLSDAEKAESAAHDLKRLRDKATRPVDLSGAVEAAGRLPKLQARLQRAKAGDNRTDAQILEEFDKSAKEKTLDEVNYAEWVAIFAKQQKFDEALADCEKAIALKSGYAPAYNLRGLVYRQKKDDDKALLDFNKAIELEPRSAVYLRNRGTLFTSQKNFGRALSDLNQAILNDPKSAPSYLQRGNVYVQQKNYDAAIADYDKALELDPKLTAAEKNRELTKKRKAGG
ncbi:tetratricopeptide repeat protein [Armatimonas sp.]|uniref:tetratricopeptide repeat protein n=1 Tax=Armatimonas sp. TaxID=1872638 RepID=UPI00286BBFCF|nr:tetratricopeptide repeat protein [Armatimonas sp.]